jgi:hypothetical protein
MYCEPVTAWLIAPVADVAAVELEKVIPTKDSLVTPLCLMEMSMIPEPPVVDEVGLLAFCVQCMVMLSPSGPDSFDVAVNSVSAPLL